MICWFSELVVVLDLLDCWFFFFFFKNFLLLANLCFFREPSKRERVRVLDRGFFCFVYPLS